VDNRRVRHLRPARTVLALGLAAAAGLVAPSAAQALGDCASQPDVRVLSDGHGTLESIEVDRRGRLFFTDSDAGTLLKLARPGAEPKLVLEGIGDTGGIVERRDGDLLVGFGNSIDQAADGEQNPEAGLLRVDPRSGASRVWVEGLQMANGVTRGPGRAIFASNDIAGGVDRVERRIPELGWADVASANGMIVSRDHSTLFVNQTFTAAAIQAVPIDDPGAATTYFAAAPADAAGGLDGLARDGDDRLYAAANGAGQVWRIDGPGEACALATRDPFPAGPSDLAFGSRRGQFPPENLYVVTFGGELLEIVDAR
jgi:gluconolactonase